MSVKIAYLVNNLSNHGGIERIISDKINAWINIYNYDVVLITLNNEGFVYPLDSNIKHFNLEISPSTQKSSLLSFAFKLRWVLKNEKINLVFTTLTSYFSMIIPFINFSIPKVLEIHSSGILLNQKSWRVKKLFISCYKKVVLLNEDEKKYYGLNNTVVIPNFIHHKKFEKKSRENIILAIGRIHKDRVKQFDHLIEIWSLIHNKNPDWKIHLYGQYDDVEEIINLKNLIKQKSLEQSFIYKGHTNNILEVMSQSKVLAMTSKTESFSIVIVEAMSQGLSVISYDSPNGPRNIISDNIDGKLIPLNNKEYYALKLNELINNQNQRMCFAESAKIKALKFTESNVMPEWNKLIHNFLKK